MGANKPFAPLVLLAAIVLAGVQSARSQTIDTYAGGNAWVTAPALQVAITPGAAAVATDGTVYYSDVLHNTVDRLDPATATVTRVAGNGTAGFSGDGGPATDASLNGGELFGVAIDGAGNLYIADVANYRIRRVTPGGIISTVAGNGTPGFSGDDGPATSASLNGALSVAVDGAANLYIADTGNNRIRKVNSLGVITTVAGNGTAGFSGDGGWAIDASLGHPWSVAVDGGGTLYIADPEHNRIRQVMSDGIISTAVGNGTPGFSGDGGPATDASLASPLGVAVGQSNDLYIADTGNSRIRRVSDGLIFPVAGSNSHAFFGDGGLATRAGLDGPSGVAVGSAGDGSDIVFIADQQNRRIRQVSSQVDSRGIISTVAGNGSYSFGGDGGPAPSASLANPYGVAVDGGGDLYIADSNNDRVRRVTPDGTISTVAGGGTFGYSGDGGPAINATLIYPWDVAVDGNGNLYIADLGRNLIRRVTPDGIIATVAGNGTFGFSGDGGPATSASLAYAYTVAVDGSGNLFIADSYNNRIRKVDSSGVITTFAGNGTAGFSGDGGPAISASLAGPINIAVDGAGILYIADQSNSRIRRVTPDGIIATVAGNGTPDFSGDGGPATSASLAYPYGVAVDGSGLYIGDGDRIRRVTPDGNIATVAGDGTYGFSGDGGPATGASLAGARGVAVDGAGTLYIADLGNGRIRRVVGFAPPPPDTTPPVIQSSVTGSLGSNGWYKTNVAVSWTVTDPESTVSSISTTGCGSTTIASDTAGQVVTCGATSAGGTASNSVTIKRDTAPPTATITTPANGAFYPAGSVVNASYSCLDTLSGVASCAGAVANGSPIDTATGGSKTFVVNATDVAGNAHTPPPTASTGYTVTTPGVSFSLAPGSLSFAPQALGVASMATTVTLTNTGTTALAITSITRTGAPNYQFRLQPPNNCGASVPVNSTCTISVEFLPTLNPPGSGPQAATLNVKAGGGGGTKSVSLSGTGVVASYTLAPQSPCCSFDNQLLNSNTYGDVTLTNTGTVPLPITTITRTGSNPGQFSASNTCGTSVAVNATCTITVGFMPTSAGAKTAFLNVKTGGGAATQSVALSGTGGPTYTLTPNALSFPNQPRNTSSGVQVATLANTGTIPLPINSITRTGGPNYQFLLTPPNTCGTSVPARLTCTISVVFHPTSAGAKTASLRVAVGGGAAAQVALSGTGT